MFDNMFQKYITGKNTAFFIITVLLIIFTMKNIEIALLLFAAFVISCSLNPFVDKLAEKKINRNLACILVLLEVFIIFLLIVIPVIVLSANEIKSFCIQFPKYIDEIDDVFLALPFVKSLGINQPDMDIVVSSIAKYSSSILTNVVSIGKNVGSAVVYFVMILIFMFYFMTDKERIKNTFLRFFPSEIRENTGGIIDTISKKVGGYMFALIITSTSVGVVMALGLMLFGVQYSLLLGLITGLLDIIPVIGPAIAFIICIITTYQSGLPAILSVVAVFSVAQLIENYFVRPYAFGKFLDLHPMLIFLFLFIAAKYLGVTGVVFAPAIAATLCVLVEELYMKKLD